MLLSWLRLPDGRDFLMGTATDSRLICPRCKGSGQERDMESGLTIVCRDCSGSGFTTTEEDDDAE